MRRFGSLFLAFLTFTIAFSGISAAESTAKLTGELPRVLEEAAADELIPVSIILKDTRSPW